jgi:UDP-N-acetyl-D-glucosamine dehydrogenase
VIRLLQQRGATVRYHDPHVPKLTEDGLDLASVPLTAATLEGAHCVIVVTDHGAVDYGMVARHARTVVDTRHVLPRPGSGSP